MISTSSYRHPLVQLFPVAVGYKINVIVTLESLYSALLLTAWPQIYKPIYKTSKIGDTCTCMYMYYTRIPALTRTLSQGSLKWEASTIQYYTHRQVSILATMYLASSLNDLQVLMIWKPYLISGSSRRSTFIPSRGIRLITLYVVLAGGIDDAQIRISLNCGGQN